MPDADVRRLLAERARLLRRYPKATPAQRRALDAYRRAGQRLEWAGNSLRATTTDIRQQQRWVDSRRIKLEAQLGRVEAGLRKKGLDPAALGASRESLARLPDVERLAPVQALARRARAMPGMAKRAERAVLLARHLRWSAAHLAQRRRHLQKAEAGVAKQLAAVKSARARLKALGL